VAGDRLAVQQRAQARRDALLTAAVQVAAEHGMAAVTHRAVTERAGLPLATVSYFFDSITELANEAIRAYAAADSELLHALAGELATQELTPDAIASAFAAAAAPRRTDTLAMFEAYLNAARTDQIRDAVADALTAARGVAAAALRTANIPAPERLSSALVALAHGFALHELAVPGSASSADLAQAARTLVIGHLVELGRVEEALALNALAH